MSLAATASLVRLSPTRSVREQVLVRELASRLRGRDDAILDRVLRELVPEVRGWIFRQLGSHPEYDDAVQEALSAIAGALHRFEGRSSLATLAHRIALRVCYRYYRRAPNPTELGDHHTSGPDVEAQVNARRALARLHVALGQLPERRRAAFVLCAVEGMNPNEAADVLGVSPNAMRSLLCRARTQLEAVLADDEELGSRP